MKNMANFRFDFDQYEALLKAVAAMARLYSDDEKPFLHSRFIEKLFVHTSQADDYSRKDMSFDAVLNDDIGVGIKTFTVRNFQSNKAEKIAEMTKDATSGMFVNLNLEALAKKSATLRNIRVRSDVNAHGIDMDKSFYHCLVRANSQAMVHEEPYDYIDVDAIKPLDKQGNEISHFTEGQKGHSYFTDGKHKYLFNISKNTLFKRFDLNSYNNSKLIDIEIYDDIFTKVLDWYASDLSELVKEKPDEDEYVVLPLYATKEKKNINNPDLVPKGSGLNQWNADGRPRKFGEAYISIPATVIHNNPGFFPSRDTTFELKLPNKKIVLAKPCSGKPDLPKSIMTDPNTDLCDWLFKIIDGSEGAAEKRLLEKRPYTYEHLRLIGKDSVKVVKRSDSSYELSMMPLDSYEKFIDNELDINDSDDN
jgi:hypothetical protein